MTKPLDPCRRFFLRERRLAAGLTQQALADAMGTTKGVVSQLETGFTRYNEDWIVKAAQALELEPADLLTPPDVAPLAARSDRVLSEIVEAWPKISDANRRALASFARQLSESGESSPG